MFLTQIIKYNTYKLRFKTIEGCAMQESVQNGNEERIVIQWKGHQNRMRTKSVVEDDEEKWDGRWWFSIGGNMICTAREKHGQEGNLLTSTGTVHEPPTTAQHVSREFRYVAQFSMMGRSSFGDSLWQPRGR